MKKTIALIFMTLLSSASVQADALPNKFQLSQMAHACFLIDADDNQKANCLNNTHQLVKKTINLTLQGIGQRDKIHTLNTKALELTIQQQQCLNLGVSKLSVIDCQLSTDIALLNYITDRYEAKN